MIEQKEMLISQKKKHLKANNRCKCCKCGSFIELGQFHYCYSKDKDNEKYICRNCQNNAYYKGENL